eukprot:SAG31_NODE_436_length_15717_cov_5.420412_15_plen_115_part_00
MPIHLEGKAPAYFIVAGLVFVAASEPYLQSEYGDDYQYDAPVTLLDRMLHGLLDNPGEQVVVLSQVLGADINVGYEDFVNTAVESFNGVKVHNLPHLASLVQVRSCLVNSAVPR